MLRSLMLHVCVNTKNQLCVFSCWLSVAKGVIWAFVGPVVAIIAVSYEE